MPVCALVAQLLATLVGVMVGVGVGVVVAVIATSTAAGVVVEIMVVVPNDLNKTVHALAHRAELARAAIDPLSGVGSASISSASFFYSVTSLALALPSCAAAPCSWSVCNSAGEQMHLSS